MNHVWWVFVFFWSDTAYELPIGDIFSAVGWYVSFVDEFDGGGAFDSASHSIC